MLIIILYTKTYLYEHRVCVQYVTDNELHPYAGTNKYFYTESLSHNEYYNCTIDFPDPNAPYTWNDKIIIIISNNCKGFIVTHMNTIYNTHDDSN